MSSEKFIPQEVYLDNLEQVPVPEIVSEGNGLIQEETERTCVLDHEPSESRFEILPTIQKERNRKLRVAALYPHVPHISANGEEKEYLEPLGLQSVMTQAVNQGYGVELFTLLNQSPDDLVEEVSQYSPDVLAVSAMTPQMSLALELTSKIKKTNPNLKIIFGGYHPSVAHSVTPEIVKSAPVDAWVRGEGEKTFSEVLTAIDESRDLSEVEGITFLKDGEIVTNPSRPRARSLDEYGRIWRPPFLRDLRNYGLTYPAPSQQTGFASIEHSRGCLGGCEFCASPVVLGQAVSFRSPEKVLEEIRYLSEEQGVNTYFFTDLDFIQRGKNQEKVEALIESLSKLEKPVYWECLGRIKSITETGNYDLLRKMYDAGCRKIGWGLESIDPEILISMNKGRHQEDEAFHVLAEAEKLGIFNTAFYIIGWHDFESNVGDNRAKILSQAEALPHYPIHRIRVTIGTPLPGSKFYEICKEKGLLTSDRMEDFDTTHLVYQHPSLGPSEISGLREQVYRSFYLNPEYQKRMTRMSQEHPEYKQTIDEYLGTDEMKSYSPKA